MNKEQTKLLVQAWELQGRITEDLERLAHMSPILAYGCIRTAETIVDVIMVNRVRSASKTAGEGGKDETR